MHAVPSRPQIEVRYPILRFLVIVYKVIGIVIITSGFVFALVQMAQIRSFGVFFAISSGITIMMSGLITGGLSWLVAEGVEVFLSIEQHMRQVAAQTTPATPAQTSVTLHSQQDLAMAVTYLEVSTRLMEHLLASHQDTGKRLDTLIAHVETLQTHAETGVRAAESAAESSRVVATMLYRQGRP